MYQWCESQKILKSNTAGLNVKKVFNTARFKNETNAIKKISSSVFTMIFFLLLQAKSKIITAMKYTIFFFFFTKLEAQWAEPVSLTCRTNQKQDLPKEAMFVNRLEQNKQI